MIDSFNRALAPQRFTLIYHIDVNYHLGNLRLSLTK